MDTSGNNDSLVRGNKNEYPVNYYSSNMVLESDANVTNTYSELIPTGNPVLTCKADIIDSSFCPPTSMLDSFCPPIWDRRTNSQHPSFSEINVQTIVNKSNKMGSREDSLCPSRSAIDKPFDMDLTPPSSMLREGMLLPGGPAIFPQSLSHLSTDSGFIESAARFSCFSWGSFPDMMKPFRTAETLSHCARGIAQIQGQQEALGNDNLRSSSDVHSQQNDVNMAEGHECAFLHVELGGTGGSLSKNEKSESLVRSNDEAKQGLVVSGNESDEVEFSSKGGLEVPSVLASTGGEPSFAKELGSKKRKRSGQKDPELDQMSGAPQVSAEDPKDNTEIQRKGDQNLDMAANKPIGKYGKQVSQALDSPKADYMHVRARRGQATNSHSLAERVRREKISERMKLLQDLVPGCSKVTGKAVMLDEIINYVQSLQRQVEFLSMKLATVNPRLDFKSEGILKKDVHPSLGFCSSLPCFPPDTTRTHASLYPGHVYLGLPGLGNSSDVLRKTINSKSTAMSMGHREPPSRARNAWEDELHNVVQMSYNSSVPLNTQDLNESLPPGHMKTEF